MEPTSLSEIILAWSSETSVKSKQDTLGAQEKPQEYYRDIVPFSLVIFAKSAYARHDVAHDLNHVYRVLDYARKIINGEGLILTELESRELPYAILLHDARDHKLVNKGICLPAEQIEQFLHGELGEESTKKILLMHERCSWSNRKTSEPLAAGDWMRKLLQDADWLDALGEIGVMRAEEYARAYGATEEEVISHTKQHIIDKLLLMPREFTYETSRRIVIEHDLLEPLKRYLGDSRM